MSDPMRPAATPANASPPEAAIRVLVLADVRMYREGLARRAPR